MWLVMVDSFSKFPFTIELQAATSSTTISCLQKIFAIEGLPQTLVSDNGSQYTSEEFEAFCHLNSIDHLTIAPFHPASNGLAERAVRTFKESFTKLMLESNDRELALFKYLSTYRTTPDPLTGKSPAELLHGRQPRNVLSVLLPKQYPKTTLITKFHVDDEVYARNYNRCGKWITGIITKVIGNKMYHVQTSTGILRRHQNQLRKRFSVSPEQSTSTTSEAEIEIDVNNANPTQNFNTTERTLSSAPNIRPNLMNSPRPQDPSTSVTTSESPSQYPVRRSQRIRKKVVRFEPD